MAASSHGLKSTILLLQVATMAGNDTWAMSSNKNTLGKGAHKPYRRKKRLK